MVVHMTVNRVAAVGDFRPKLCVFGLLKSIALHEKLEPQSVIFRDGCQQSDILPYIFIQVAEGHALAVARPTEITIIEILNPSAGHIHVVPERYCTSSIAFGHVALDLAR